MIYLYGLGLYLVHLGLGLVLDTCIPSLINASITLLLVTSRPYTLHIMAQTLCLCAMKLTFSADRSASSASYAALKGVTHPGSRGSSSDSKCGGYGKSTIFLLSDHSITPGHTFPLRGSYRTNTGCSG